MIKVYSTLVLLICLSLFACSSDDNNQPIPATTNTSLVGVWRLESAISGGNAVSLTDCQKQTGVTFFDNGVVEELFILSDPCQLSTGSATYTFNGTAITVTEPTQTTVYNVVSLSATHLVAADTFIEGFPSDVISTYVRQ